MKSLTFKHKTILLGIAASLGVIATGISAANAVPKAVKLMKKAEKKKGADLTNFEKVKATAPAYAFPITMGLGTILCVWGSMILSINTQANLASAYGLISSSYSKYKEKVKELHGEEAHEEIIQAIMVDKDFQLYSPTIMGTANTSFDDDEEPRLFYDAFSERYFETTYTKVLEAQLHLNRNYMLNGLVIDVNEWYKFLGLPPIKGGDELLWASVDEVYFIDFVNYKAPLEDKPIEASENYLECVVIEFAFNPITEYEYNNIC